MADNGKNAPEGGFRGFELAIDETDLNDIRSHLKTMASGILEVRFVKCGRRIVFRFQGLRNVVTEGGK